MKSPSDDVLEPYGSAEDLPSVVELRKLLHGAKLLTQVVGRSQRQEFLKVERELTDLVRVVDAFYSLLGPRNWIFHDDLNHEAIAALIQLPVADAETAFIELYRDDHALWFMSNRLHGHEAMSPRMDLIAKAREDYAAGRYYAVVLLLLSVMDGFVNDVDKSRRRGLHSREASELNAWDSIVGHHMGLSSAHRSFTQSTYRTSGEPVLELHRHGIIHGTLTNFDNVIVATKAWNRLFAVSDWAKSLERQTPAPPAPSLKETWTQLRQAWAQFQRLAATKQALANWVPSQLHPSDPAFASSAPCIQAAAFLDAWKASNFGRMAESLFLLPSRSQIGEVRRAFEQTRLFDFEPLRADLDQPAVMVFHIRVTLEDRETTAKMRWLRLNNDGNIAAPNEDAKWQLYSSTPEAMFRP